MLKMPALLQRSAIDILIDQTLEECPQTHAPQYHHLAIQTLHNLQYQHDWTSLVIHTHSTTTPEPSSSPRKAQGDLLPRPLVSGVPPRRAYIHPDEQIELIKAGIRDEDVPPEREWVLPTHLREKWSLKRFGEVFDVIECVPPEKQEDGSWKYNEPGKWRGVKRLLLATIDDDSTVVYYIVHDGIVKPRQN